METTIANFLFRRIFPFILYSIWIYTDCVTANEVDDMKNCLLELKMSELLRLQHSLQSMKQIGKEEDSSLAKQVGIAKLDSQKKVKAVEETSENCASQNCMRPMAMALTGTPRGYHANTAYHEHHPWQPEERPSKLQTLFHVSVTALSFLSFGGYLLCLIVQAIKSKGTTYFHPVATASTTTNGGVKRIKIYRRGRREVTDQAPQMRNVDWVMNYGYGDWF